MLSLPIKQLIDIAKEDLRLSEEEIRALAEAGQEMRKLQVKLRTLINQ